ncbi:hypothetical protein BCD67_00385 [Oscillatoriales cyanobacterium USR001]|nr:hypothetical protein BCD67_00385 [Oscillatoriales cyanobacterium USR001]
MATSIAVQQALSAIAEFEQSTFPSLWPGLDKEQIIAEMRSRIHNPFNISQGSQPFCGPAAILFELVRKNPLYYVQICRNLFQIGGFHSQSQKWIAPSPRLLETTGKFQMPQADWMVLSTLRESENLIFPVEPNAPKIIRNISGMTKPWEMVGWAREILGYSDVKYHHSYIFGDVSALQRAADTINAGGVAFPLISAEGMLTNKPSIVPFPSHWVALLGNITIQQANFSRGDRGRISCDLYTWAKQMRVDLVQKTFEDYFWGIVIAK